MATYAELRARIEDDIDRTDLTSQVQKAINRSINFYNRKRTYFNEQQATTNTVSGTEYYAIPGDTKEIDSLVITVSNTKYELVRKPFLYIDKQSILTSNTGRPVFWALYKEEIRLYPIPDGAYTLTISYHKDYDNLSLSSDTNDWSLECEALIEARARWWVYTRILNDKNGAALARAEEIEEWRNIQSQTDKMLFSGRITGTQF